MEEEKKREAKVVESLSKANVILQSLGEELKTHEE